MSRQGNCWDNAPLESFFATLEKDLLRAAIFDYIEGFYNTRRLHSGLGYQSPAHHENSAA